MKKIIISTVVLFIVWTGIDFFFHGYLLEDAYLATAELWRPMEEAKMGLNSFVVLVTAAVFSIIYVLLIERHSMGNALLYGFLFGLSIGIGAGYGSFAFMPIPYYMALTWFAVPIIKGVVGGILLAYLAK